MPPAPPAATAERDDAARVCLASVGSRGAIRARVRALTRTPHAARVCLGAAGRVRVKIRARVRIRVRVRVRVRVQRGCA